jgi:hypothetical protein
MRFNHASLQYKLKRTPMNEVLRERIKERAWARVRYGYRRIHVLLQREGGQVNPKRVARLYRLGGLSLRANEGSTYARCSASCSLRKAGFRRYLGVVRCGEYLARAGTRYCCGGLASPRASCTR